VLYFFLWPDESRDPAAGTVLFKMTVPFAPDTTPESALALAQEFVGTVFTEGVRP
jgi:hypothetical protein